MSCEFAFAFIKPDGMDAGLTDKIRAMLTCGGLSIIMEVDLEISRAQAARHYDKSDQWCQSVGSKRHDFLSKRGNGVSKTPTELGRDILASVRETITTAPVHAFILCGENANAELRKIVGDTDPARAEEGTIRSLSKDSFKIAEEELRPVRNIIHASETPADARKEIMNLWPELAPLMQFLLFP